MWPFESDKPKASENPNASMKDLAEELYNDLVENKVFDARSIIERAGVCNWNELSNELALVDPHLPGYRSTLDNTAVPGMEKFSVGLQSTSWFTPKVTIISKPCDKK